MNNMPQIGKVPSPDFAKQEAEMYLATLIHSPMNIVIIGYRLIMKGVTAWDKENSLIPLTDYTRLYRIRYVYAQFLKAIVSNSIQLHASTR